MKYIPLQRSDRLRIVLAKTAGFCFGVDRAVNIVYDSVEKNKKICTLGPVIHNPQVVEDLQQKGVFVINSLGELVQRDTTVVIRTHGIPKEEYEYLQEHTIDYIDATCPYVKKIHTIVNKYYQQGYKIIIVGDRDHPEVIGINGWCGNSAMIVGSAQEAGNLDLEPDSKLCIVSQTTLNRSLWEAVLAALNGYDCLVHDTICSATNERQTEAEEIAAQVDSMVVIGGKNSSNTKKLVEVCQAHCPTYHVENAGQLDLTLFRGKKVGITAGASTPAYIIKEVIDKMTEENTMTQSEFADELDKTLKTLNTGDIVRGTVISMTPTEVYVNLGAKSDGFIPVSELSENPDVNPEDVVKVGEEVEAFVVRVNDVEGTIQLSVKKVASIKGWETIEKAMEEKQDLTGKVLEVIKGGMIMLVNGLRVFIPASLANDRFMRDLSPLVGKELPVRIIDVNMKRRKVVGSVKVILDEQRAVRSKEVWDSIEAGKHYNGVVKSLTSFGAFVDIGGVDGLIHISELSWKRIKHPSEVVSVGDIVDTYVIDFNKETGKISLGYRNPADDPWEKVKELTKGQTVKCKVVRLVPFGAFVEVVPDVDGLIHISQIADHRIGKPADVLSVGQEVEAKLLDIDFENQKISLSIRALLEEGKQEEPQAAVVEETPATEEVYSEEMKVTLGDLTGAVGEAVTEPEEEPEEPSVAEADEAAATTTEE